MRKLYCKSGTVLGLALLPSTAFAAQLEQLQTAINTVVLYTVILFVIVVAIYVYFMRLRDRRRGRWAAYSAKAKPSIPLDRMPRSRNACAR